MTTYSAFFASGLQASYYRETTPVPPSSPLLVPADIDRSPTPTPSTALPRTLTDTNTDRPRLRKRRSSLTVAVSPMNNIKSPMRSAGAALQRHTHAMNVAMSPNRSRSGSVTGDVSSATQANSIMGRLRSGSVGSALRSRRALRGTPAAPPPTAPLPALPSLLGMSSASLSFSSTTAPPTTQTFLHQRPITKRPPLMHRSTPVDNLFMPDYTTKIMGAMNIPEMSPIDPEFGYSIENGYRIDEEMKEN